MPTDSNLHRVRFGVLTTALLKIRVFRNVTPCRRVVPDVSEYRNDNFQGQGLQDVLLHVHD